MEQEITLEYFNLSTEQANATMFLPPDAARACKVEKLAELGITVTDNQTPLQAWIFAMCRANNLPETLPALAIGDAANELCPRWVWFLA
ncbi:MAG: hypothetical protein R3C14_40535 [Caldilineaceae bacterium]